MKNIYSFLLFVLFFLCFNYVVKGQTGEKHGVKSEEQWQKEYEELIDERKSLNRSYRSLETEIDSLKTLSADMERLRKKCDSSTYVLVGKRNAADVKDYRKYFEESEKILIPKMGTFEDAKRRFSELSALPEKCLPEFRERLVKLEDKLSNWPHNCNIHRYQVKSGDCLTSISNELFKTPVYWWAIWEANKNSVLYPNEVKYKNQRSVRDPNLIFPGQNLYIPYILYTEDKDDITKVKEYIKTNTHF